MKLKNFLSHMTVQQWRQYCSEFVSSKSVTQQLSTKEEYFQNKEQFQTNNLEKQGTKKNYKEKLMQVTPIFALEKASSLLFWRISWFHFNMCYVTNNFTLSTSDNQAKLHQCARKLLVMQTLAIFPCTMLIKC